MAAGRDDRSSRLEQPLLAGRDDACSQLEQPLLSELNRFTSSASAVESHFLTVDVGANESPAFSRRNSFQVDDSIRETSRVPDTPGHFRSTSSLYRDVDEYDSGEEIGREDAKKTNDQKEKARRARIRRSLRNPIMKKSYVKRAAYSATNHPMQFLKTVLWGSIMWPKWTWDAMASQMTLTIVSLKSGIAAGLVSIICVLKFPAPYDELSSIAVWAVVTIDLLYEGNIGLSLSKGVNRVAGTLAAGALAVGLTQLGPDVPKHLYPYYTVLWVFFGGFAFRFLKGIPPLKDQWGYAFTVATIAFHILLLNSYLQPERVTLPLLRFLMILVGFFLASIINLAFKPVYAGDTLHKLVAKNFDIAADVLERCVTEYANYTMLDHVPDILSGRSEDDKIHQTYHEIVMSDSDLDKLVSVNALGFNCTYIKLGAVTWEPCHGAFFRGYPWHLYDDISDYLRYTLYDVIALDSCLRASIQAPKDLRDIFSQEMKEIAQECSKVLRMLGESVRTMTAFDSQDLLRKAEEAAIELQNKIYIHTHLLLGKGAAESPRYPLYVASSRGVPDLQRNCSGSDNRNFDPNDPWATFEVEQHHCYEESTETGQRAAVEENGNGNASSLPAAVLTHEDHVNRGFGTRCVVDCDHRCETEQQDSPQLSRCNSIQYTPRDGGAGVDECSSRIGSTDNRHGSHNRLESIQVDDGLVSNENVEPQEKVNRMLSGFARSKNQTRGWKQTFKKRRSNLGNDYEGAEQRISALSLVKFASLLIEVVVKMKYVVTAVVELGEAARFKGYNTDGSRVQG